MNRINFSNLGGLPVTQAIFDFMQVSASAPIGAFASLCGPLTILTGCTVTGSVNGNGWVSINGEILPFEGGSITGTVGIIETVTQRTFEDAVDKDVYVARKAANVVDGAYDLADFVRLPRLRDVAPAGLIAEWPSATMPDGWLLCNGQEVSRTGYAALFACIGTAYGVGNGTTTFNLPDRRGRVAVGLDDGQIEFETLGGTGGAKTHTLIIDELPSHNHTLNAFDPDNPVGGSGDGDHWKIGAGNPIGFTGGDAPHNNLQPYVVANFIIKY